jgi:hypothetical protein
MTTGTTSLGIENFELKTSSDQQSGDEDEGTYEIKPRRQVIHVSSVMYRVFSDDEEDVEQGIVKDKFEDSEELRARYRRERRDALKRREEEEEEEANESSGPTVDQVRQTCSLPSFLIPPLISVIVSLDIVHGADTWVGST